MPTPSSKPFADDEVFAVTIKGSKELKAAGTSLGVQELEVLVLVDGFSTVAQIAQRVPSLSRAEVDTAIRKHLAAQLIISTAEPESDVEASGFSTISVPAGFFSGLTLDQSPEADGGLSILRKKGFYVRIARRPASSRDGKGWKPTILVIDDDMDLQKLIRTYFTMEGFQLRAALKRDDILIALRQQPPPDLILLDVNLPDANGFEILARMRQHPALKTMPVVMLTAESTREAVLRGLTLGADGYVTKPFEPDILVGAVKAVLGIDRAEKSGASA
jgi:two-component system, OmpR family, response regulator